MESIIDKNYFNIHLSSYNREHIMSKCQLGGWDSPFQIFTMLSITFWAPWCWPYVSNIFE